MAEKKIQRQDSDYDLVVVGAGHAGCEAALAAARLGCRTLLLNLSLDFVSSFPFGPGVGGDYEPLLREIDALGGLMPRLIDRSLLWKQLVPLFEREKKNLFALIDKRDYFLEVRKLLEREINLELKQAQAIKIAAKNRCATGVVTRFGQLSSAKAIIIAAGTFLNGEIRFGSEQIPAGRYGEVASKELAEDLREKGFCFERRKIRVSPSLNARSLRSRALETVESLKEPIFFSFYGKSRRSSGAKTPYLACRRESKEESKKIFLQPEGRHTKEIYADGFFSRSSVDSQERELRKFFGLERAEIMRPGYEISYDCLDSSQVKDNFETRLIENLFVAGRMIGARSYEEAAAQGLVAGINAALKVKGEPPLALDRNKNLLIKVLPSSGKSAAGKLKAEEKASIDTEKHLELAYRGHELGLVTSKELRFYEKSILKLSR